MTEHIPTCRTTTKLSTAAVAAVLAVALGPATAGHSQSRPTELSVGTTGITWTADWIGRDNPTAWPANGQQNPAPLLRKEFSADKKVKSASLSVVGLGYYVAYLNGERIGDQVLDPAPSAYDRSAFSRSFDVTAALRKGDNVLSATLGRSYAGVPTVGGTNFNLPRAPWRTEPRLLAQLDLTFVDGSTQRVVTDDSWKIADSGTLDNLFYGERFDARAAKAGWTELGYNDSAWASAEEQPAPTAKVVPATAPPQRVTETLAPVSVTPLADGSKVYDFGKVTAGWARIQVSGTEGSSIRMVYGQKLRADGTVHQLTDGAPDIHVDTYTLGEAASQIWEPSFTRHGFRYVQVSASEPLTSFEIAGRVVHSDLPSTGSFDSSSTLLDTIQQNQRNSLRNNLWGIPTDTAWRDRQGWTADAWLYLDSAALNFDVKDFYADWLGTYRESQKANGSLPVIVPDPGFLPIGDDPSWSGTYVLMVDALHQHYGDERLVAENYDAMAKWMKLMRTKVTQTGGLYTGFSFGDWCPPKYSCFAPEKSDLSANADLYREAVVLAAMATQLGHAEDARTFAQLADDIKAAFNAKFLDIQTGVYRTVGNPFTGGGDPGYRQTSNVLPLAYGMVPQEHEAAVVANLVKDVRDRGNDLNTGAIGTKHLLPVLTEHGHADLAYTLATQTDFPSWGNWVEQGATTSWEEWDGGGLGAAIDHAFQGTIDDWLYQHLAGIRSAAPGYARVLIAPVMPAGLDEAAASVRSPGGQISSTWTRSGVGVTLKVDIPRGTPTEVRVPVDSPDSRVITDTNARLVRTTATHRVYTVQGGTSTFRVLPPVPRG